MQPILKIQFHKRKMEYFREKVNQKCEKQAVRVCGADPLHMRSATTRSHAL